MKFYLLLLSLCSLACLADPVTLVQQSYTGYTNHMTDGLYRLRGKLRPPMTSGEGESQPQSYREQLEQYRVLKKVKYHLVNGELHLAKLHLNQNINSRTALRPVSLRYLGMLNFTEGRFESSFKTFNAPELTRRPHFAKVCLLQTLNRIALNMLPGLEDEWDRCKIENARHLKAVNLKWMDMLVQLKASPTPGLTSTPFKGVRLDELFNDDLKILLKLALYLNQEHLIISQLYYLTLEQMQDKEVREIAGQILFRSGSFANAYRFIEDIKSPNVDNIKGNLYVLRSKYELAYAQFKLALEQKQNSQNALERLLPLAWLLGDWSNGTIYAERVMASPQTQISKLTLYAAFLTQKGEFEQAQKVLASITRHSRQGTRLEVTQLQSFVGIMRNDPLLLRQNAELSCRQYDLVNCWLLFQTIQWGTFPVTIRREDAPVIKSSWEQLTREAIHEPLKEVVYVNQMAIEEMDDRLIQIVPQN